MKHTKPTLGAVIDIGSGAIRMIVAEQTSDGRWRHIDRSSKPALLGHDVFETGRIRATTVREVIDILKGF